MLLVVRDHTLVIIRLNFVHARVALPSKVLRVMIVVPMRFIVIYLHLSNIHWLSIKRDLSLCVARLEFLRWFHNLLLIQHLNVDLISMQIHNGRVVPCIYDSLVRHNIRDTYTVWLVWTPDLLLLVVEWLSFLILDGATCDLSPILSELLPCFVAVHKAFIPRRWFKNTVWIACFAHVSVDGNVGFLESVQFLLLGVSKWFVGWSNCAYR